jgi:hypothetical protein
MEIVKRTVLQQGRLLVQHVIPAILKPAHTLWNEIIGFLFLCFAALFGFYAIRYFLAADWPRLFFAGFCTCMMAYFGLSSFRRARKISRS